MGHFFAKLFLISPARRNALLRLPLVVFPGLCLIFYTLHGGSGVSPRDGALGLNPQLPPASVRGRQLLDKKLQYEAAERDSIRKSQFERQDPYRRDSGMIAAPARNYAGRTLAPAIATRGSLKTIETGVNTADPRAAQLLDKLRQLQQSIRRPQSPIGLGSRGVVASGPDGFGRDGYSPGVRQNGMADTVGDARVGQLNAMLDKVIRIQHPQEARTVAVSTGRTTDIVEPADSTVNTITAVVADDQTLTSGTTLALRITDSIRINGRLWPAGQLVYGVVRIENDRMLVRVTSLREDRSLYVTDLEVYDVDGLPGIHIPGLLSRDVLKQSTDQGVNSLNVLNADPSLGAEAASAGIQTVKTFLGRKVKQVRVTVRAGYQVLLREAHPRARLLRDSGAVSPPKGSPAVLVHPPEVVPDGSVIAHCRTEGVELRCRGIGLADGRLWLGLEWSNHSPIAYAPAYCRWFIRDRRRVRRTAMQELPLEPLSDMGSLVVAGDSVVHSWTGFAPFTVARDKELVLEVGEKNGGRVLELVINHRELLNAKDYGKGQAKGESADQPGDHPL